MIRGEEFVYTLQDQSDDVEFRFMDKTAESGEQHYYVRVQQADGQMAWSSPIWLTRP